MGSKSDWPTMRHALEILEQLDVLGGSHDPLAAAQVAVESTELLCTRGLGPLSLREQQGLANTPGAADGAG